MESEDFGGMRIECNNSSCNTLKMITTILLVVIELVIVLERIEVVAILIRNSKSTGNRSRSRNHKTNTDSNHTR